MRSLLPLLVKLSACCEELDSAGMAKVIISHHARVFCGLWLPEFHWLQLGGCKQPNAMPNQLQLNLNVSKCLVDYAALVLWALFHKHWPLCCVCARVHCLGLLVRLLVSGVDFGINYTATQTPSVPGCSCLVHNSFGSVAEPFECMWTVVLQTAMLAKGGAAGKCMQSLISVNCYLSVTCWSTVHGCLLQGSVGVHHE
jgi:hypothetical protein